MKIQQVSIKNFRNIENLSENIDGHNILLLGENSVGKSNFLKALQIALGNTDVVGVDPIMHGKREATIQVITDDKGNKYEFEVKFKDGKDKPTITVKAPNGLKNTSKSVIASLVGSIDFDIDAFVEMSRTEKGRKEQVEIVRSFLPEETKEVLRKHENKVKLQYDDRTEVNRQIKTIEGFIKESEISSDDMIEYAEPKNVDDLTKEVNAAIEHNQNVQKAASTLEAIQTAIKTNDTRITELRDEIKRLAAENEAKEEQAKKIVEWQKKNAPADITQLQSTISHANEHNLRHQKIKDVQKQEARANELRKEAESLTILIETSRQLISDTIKDLDMPVAGLSFTDDSLTYNDSIVDESTLSTSEIMMLGVKLKMAKNPNARVLFIERGESLGAKKLEDLQQMAKDYDFQIILEQVMRGQDSLTIEIMPEYQTQIEPAK